MVSTTNHTCSYQVNLQSPEECASCPLLQVPTDAGLTKGGLLSIPKAPPRPPFWCADGAPPLRPPSFPSLPPSLTRWSVEAHPVLPFLGLPFSFASAAGWLVRGPEGGVLFPTGRSV